MAMACLWLAHQRRLEAPDVRAPRSHGEVCTELGEHHDYATTTGTAATVSTGCSFKVVRWARPGSVELLHVLTILHAETSTASAAPSAMYSPIYAELRKRTSKMAPERAVVHARRYMRIPSEFAAGNGFALRLSLNALVTRNDYP